MLDLSKLELTLSYNNLPLNLNELKTYPLIMANDSELEKKAPPGKIVTVSLPALIKSASTSVSEGYGPRPNIPFSLCKITTSG